MERLKNCLNIKNLTNRLRIQTSGFQGKAPPLTALYRLNSCALNWIKMVRNYCQAAQSLFGLFSKFFTSEFWASDETFCIYQSLNTNFIKIQIHVPSLQQFQRSWRYSYTVICHLCKNRSVWRGEGSPPFFQSILNNNMPFDSPEDRLKYE